MKKTKDQLQKIYNRTSGYCHLCGKKLAFINYNRSNRRGAWHIEHSNPRSKGGSDRLLNLYAACIKCNNEKSNFTTRTARGWNGRSCAPLSHKKRSEAKAINAFIGAGAGLALGLVFGPWGRLIGPLTGAYLGHKQNPDK